MLPRTLLLLGLLSMATACRGTAPPSRDAADITAVPTAATEPAGLATPANAGIVIWTVPDFAPVAESGDALPFGEELDAYRMSNPETDVTVAVKPAYGPNGILAHLRATNDVVPGQLPDVAVVPIEVITDAVAAGFAQPLLGEALVDRAFDAFPFASERAYDTHGTVRAVPFAVDLLHAIAREEMPARLEELTPERPLVVSTGEATLPATAVLLAVYAGANASLELLPRVSESALVTAMDPFVSSARSGGIVFVESAGTGRAAWSSFLARDSGGAAVTGGLFLWQQANFPSLAWGQLPGPASPAPSIAWGWAFIVTARDDVRRARAESLVEFVTEGARRGWIPPTGYLPAWPEGWRSTVAGAVEPVPAPEYLDFLVEQLIRALSADSPDGWASGWSGALSTIAAGGSLEDAIELIDPHRD